MNRALALASVLTRKIGKHTIIYVPSLTIGSATTHARMFQTITPYAVMNNLQIDSRYAVKDAEGVSSDILNHREGVILMVWEHKNIPGIAKKLSGTPDKIPAEWAGSDFDSIWKITIQHKNDHQGKFHTIDKEGIAPSDECRF